MNKTAVLDFLNNKIQDLKIAVIGDIMLDKYYFGEVRRISPEAPVPINRIEGERSSMGGAANVAHNLAKLGAKVYMSGIVGCDSNREVLLQLLRGVGIDTGGVVVSVKQPTIAKLRVIGSRQQMLRLDFENPQEPEAIEQEKILNWLDGLLSQGLDGIIISDYGKSACTQTICQAIINKARSAQVAVLVDPKGYDWSKYDWANYITPNVKEMGEAVGIELINHDQAVVNAANTARITHDIDNVIVTRSEKGLTFVSKGLEIHDQAMAREVFDVSGAGDTMAATLMAAIAGGLERMDCIKLSNMAAGIVVGKVGTQPVTRSELIESVRALDRETSYEQKIATQEQAATLVQAWRDSGKKVIFTNGCFDILHIGHANYLADARKLGDKLVVGLNSDMSITALKGPTRPLVDEGARAGLLAALACVDLVVLFSEQTPEYLLSMLQPNVLVKGGDYKAEEVLGREYVQEVKILPFLDGYSTTNLVNKIADLARENKI